MSVNEWFRRNQKRVYAIMIFAMGAWGIGTSAMYLIPQKAVGTIFNEKITRDEFADVESRWRRIFFSGVQRPILDLIWKQMVYIHEADRLRIVVTDRDVQDGIQNLSFPFFGGKTNLGHEHLVRLLCNTFRVNQDQLLQTIKEAMLIEKLGLFMRNSIKTTTEEAWQRYSMENEGARIKYVAFDAERFAGTVEITEEEVRLFYDKYKDVYPDKATGSYGYKEPEKRKIEYIMADYNELMKKVNITDEEIIKYYEENKEIEFKESVENKTVNKDSGVNNELNKDIGEDKTEKETDKEEIGGVPDKNENEKDKINVQDEVKDAKAVQDSKESPESSRYKPLDEVRELIKKNLQRKVAINLANELISKVDEEIYENLDKSKRPSFHELAGKYGLVYDIPKPGNSQDGFFTKDEAGMIFLGPDRFDSMVFERELYEPSPPLEAFESKYIFQVIDKHLPDSPPLSEIYEKVEGDLKIEKAFRKVMELSEQCLNNMKKTSFQDGLDSFNSELGGGNLQVEETEYFNRPLFSEDRPSGYIVAMKAYRPNVAAKAFTLKKDELAIVAEEGDKKACYIIMLLDKKEAGREKFEENKGQLLRRYLTEKQMHVMAQWEENLMKQARLDI